MGEWNGLESEGFLLWCLPFFSNLHLHLMCLEIFDEAREVHLLPIVELLEGSRLDSQALGRTLMTFRIFWSLSIVSPKEDKAFVILVKRVSMSSMDSFSSM